MTGYIVLTALFLAIIAFLAWMHWRDRADWRDERQELLDRIQAPQTVLSRSVEPPTGAQTIPWDDDDKYWESVKGELNVGS